MLRPLKMFISSTKDGLWHVQQSAKAEFLPLLFAFAKQVESEFVKGTCAVKLSKGQFKGVWLDYTLETTANKDLKAAGGIIGLTMKGPALYRWCLAHPVTALYAAQFHAFIGGGRSRDHQQHRSVQKASQSRWYGDVKKLKDMFNDTYIDPFNLTDSSLKLENIATGAIATGMSLQCPGKGGSYGKDFCA